MRLIDVDKLLDDFQIWPICDDCTQLEDTKCELSGRYICLAIQNAPTVDAIPVKWLIDRLEAILNSGVLSGKPDDNLNIRSIIRVLRLWGIKMEVKA